MSDLPGSLQQKYGVASARITHNQGNSKQTVGLGILSGFRIIQMSDSN